MRLKDLNSNYTLDFEITGVASDSREVQPGNLFISIPSVIDNKKQKEYIQQAIIKGAQAIITDKANHFYSTTVPVIAVEDAAQECARIAAKYYSRKPKYIMAVTGTNGKTSTVRFCEQIIDNCEQQAVSIGTLGVSKINKIFRAKTHQFTNMDVLSLHKILNEIKEDYVVMEATSHGLVQHRLDCIDLHAAAFTNLSHDHLDYHKTLSNYFQAKQRLFTDLLPPGKTAILNADVPEYQDLRAVCKQHKIVSYGYKGEEIKLLKTKADGIGQHVDLEVFGKQYKDIYIPLIGEFQIFNALCALGMATSSPDIAVESAIQALSKLSSVPGRMQYVGAHNGGNIYVDYAHSSDSLEKLLTSTRAHCAGKLHIVFGCGGERDQFKRPLMGAVAANMADAAYVTDDNPRFEDPAKIRQEVMKAAPNATEIPDRREAIKHAITNLKANDILLIAGKGHEDYQIIGNKLVPFNDFEVATQFIEESA